MNYIEGSSYLSITCHPYYNFSPLNQKFQRGTRKNGPATNIYAENFDSADRNFQDQNFQQVYYFNIHLEAHTKLTIFNTYVDKLMTADRPSFPKEMPDNIGYYNN